MVRGTSISATCEHRELIETFPRWIGVFGFQSCTYSLSTYLTTSCDCSPSSHGKCSSGSNMCVCSKGWAGQDCTVPVLSLDNSSPRQDTVATNQWAYYSFSVPMRDSSGGRIGSNVAVVVKELDTEGGNAWVYLTQGVDAAPTRKVYDWKDEATDSPLHVLNIDTSDFTVNPPSPMATAYRTFNVGVWGSPFLPVGLNQTYQLEVYYSDF